MYIPLYQLKHLNKFITPNKVVVIYGPGRCGKTTLINKFLEKYDGKYLFVSGEDFTVQKILNCQSITKLKD